MENILREVFNSWLARELPEVIEREYKIKLSDEIIAIIGPRRAGKTYFMFQIIKKLLKSGFSKKNLVYVDFEDIRLKNLKAKDYSTFIKVLHEIFQEKNGKLVLLLDEIQNLEEWEKWIRSLHNSKKYYIFISGSSSKLSSREIPTQLRGRYISKLILPFSFNEFLKFKKFKLEFLEAPEVKGRLLKILREYLEFGGFPEVVKKQEKAEKIELLKTYKETVFYRDVVEKFKVRDIASLETFLNLAMENFGKYLSVSKLKKYFKSIGIKKSKKTLANYLKYFENAFFLFTIEKFSYKTKERVAQPKKVYSFDSGFYKLVPRFSSDYGILMESLVARELFKKKFYGEIDVFYFKDYQQHEVDFVIKEGLKVKQLIQVTYASGRDEIDKREIKGLVKASDLLNCNNLLCITWDCESEERIKGKLIRFVPLWKWLLDLKIGIIRKI